MPCTGIRSTMKVDHAPGPRAHRPEQRQGRLNGLHVHPLMRVAA